ncbi:MAG: HAD family hydrolase, partial [Planctomycetota bacterium]|nr:HAD family hydrolase [Planctomycetota bacterium]
RPADRIAVFDNDGTLWPEQPMPFQLAFVLDEIRRLEPDHPEWKDRPIIQAALKGDVATIHHEGMKGALELLAVTHGEVTVEEFNDRVRNWMRTAQHPRFKRLYRDLAYQPMLEVLELFRANGFKTFIVSGGGADFMRVWSEEIYGIPSEQVIGSYAKLRYELRDDKPVLFKEAALEFVDDKAGKPVAIHRFIGKTPAACFGNSDGDKEMLELTTIGRPGHFGLIVHHTDAEREYQYDKVTKSTGQLIEALADAPKRGWTVVDMRRDWKQVFREKR